MTRYYTYYTPPVPLAPPSVMSKNRYSSPEQRAPPDCQDWTTVTMSKTKKQESTTTQTVKNSATHSNVNSASAIVAATSSNTGGGGGADDLAKKTKYIAKATSDTVRQARCDKKLTQKELAQKCNMDVSIIAEIERGGNCVYNAAHVNKIQMILGVKIPRAVPFH